MTSISSETWPVCVPSMTGEKSTDSVIGAASVDMPFNSRSLVSPLEGSRLSSMTRLVCAPLALVHTNKRVVRARRQRDIRHRHRGAIDRQRHGQRAGIEQRVTAANHARGGGAEHRLSTDLDRSIRAIGDTHRAAQPRLGVGAAWWAALPAAG